MFRSREIFGAGQFFGESGGSHAGTVALSRGQILDQVQRGVHSRQRPWSERVAEWRERLYSQVEAIDFAPDLAQDIGSARWFRGLGTLLGLTAFSLSPWPDFAPLEAAPAMHIDEGARDEFRSQMILPLALALLLLGRDKILNRVFIAYAALVILAGIGASIINVGSSSGLVPLSRVFTYSMTKAAVHNLTKNLAREWGPLGIRANVLVPGFFPAEQNRNILTPERNAAILGRTPLGRFGEADELGGATLLLASDAGAFITGTELVVDGGFNAMSI